MLHIHLRSIDLLCGKEISFKKFRAYDTIERKMSCIVSTFSP